MILQRMESGPDVHREAEAEASNLVPSPPIPAIPAVPIMAEAPFFVAEDMSQLVATLQPPALLPPPELGFRTARSADPLAELETAIAATRMRLLQPGEDAEAEAAPEPQEEAAASNPLAEMQADLPSPAPAASSELMKRAAATVIGRAPFGAVPSAEIFPAAESDADDFLFAPEMQNQQHDPADFLLEPAPHETPRYTPPEPEPREPEWESGTYPDLALVTPQTVEASEPAQPKQARPHSDSLAPLRALSEAQKIALFS
jgi:hypothetical protein